jgi:predicted anti-sigma-YlaC factor YlaD
MKITRDVVRDLLPAYLSGEATADTVALVEEFLKNEPEMAGNVEAAKRLELPPLRHIATPRTVEREALMRTRRRLQGRGILLGLALFFTMLPMSFVFTDTIRWVMWRDSPGMASASAALALLFWTMWILLRVKLRSTGL